VWAGAANCLILMTIWQYCPKCETCWPPGADSADIKFISMKFLWGYQPYKNPHNHIFLEVQTAGPHWIGTYAANKLKDEKSAAKFHYTRSPAIAEGPRDAGVPVEIW